MGNRNWWQRTAATVCVTCLAVTMALVGAGNAAAAGGQRCAGKSGTAVSGHRGGDPDVQHHFSVRRRRPRHSRQQRNDQWRGREHVETHQRDQRPWWGASGQPALGVRSRGRQHQRQHFSADSGGSATGNPASVCSSWAHRPKRARRSTSPPTPMTPNTDAYPVTTSGHAQLVSPERNRRAN